MISPFIDAHVHLNSPSTAKMEKALEHGASFLSINTDVPGFQTLDKQEDIAIGLKQKFPYQVNFLTTFTIQNWKDSNWEEKALDKIKKGMDKGASGVKIWKNIGMELREEDGRFVMIDNEKLDKILDYLSENGIPLLGHQGEPRNCWLPLEQMTVDSDRNYFQKYPKYHMYLYPDFPGYDCQIAARDKMLSKHPDLLFIGAHLASLEWDVAELAKWLDHFPQAMADMAERICHLQLQASMDRKKVREFLIRYQNRILYGTDLIDDGSMDQKEFVGRMEYLWQFHWEFLATDKWMHASEFPETFQGLALPQEVLENIFYKNAAKVYGFKEHQLTI